jgi:hypothetical protein
MEGFPFPTCDSLLLPPDDGFLVKCPAYFKGLNTTRFESFFKGLGQEERPHVDPVGFTVFPFNIGGKRIFVCGIRVIGFFDRKKTKDRIDFGEFNPKIPLAQFLDTITKFRGNAPASRQMLPPQTESYESKEFVSVTMHEIRRLNLQIKAQGEEMIENLSSIGQKPDTQFLNYRAQNIFATSNLVSIRLDSYDFHVNPNVFATERKVQIPVYKKFEKVMHCLQVLCQREHVRIRLFGQTFVTISGYSVFDLLPFVLLENAVKYSPQNQEISVNFSAESGALVVVVESLGPVLLPDEKEKIFDRGVRGQNASNVKSGTGAGLHFAKLVCDLHNIGISAESDTSRMVRLDDIPYAQFRVKLVFPK